MKFWAHKIIDKIYPNRDNYGYGFGIGTDVGTSAGIGTDTSASRGTSTYTSSWKVSELKVSTRD